MSGNNVIGFASGLILAGILFYTPLGHADKFSAKPPLDRAEGFYVSATLGWLHSNFSGVRSNIPDHFSGQSQPVVNNDDGILWGVALGSNVSMSPFRAEVYFQQNAKQSFSVRQQLSSSVTGAITNLTQVAVDQSLLLGRLYLDRLFFKNYKHLNTFIGVGLGGSINKVSAKNLGQPSFYPTKTTVTFSPQFIAGFDYAFMAHYNLGLNYTYTSMGHVETAYNCEPIPGVLICNTGGSHQARQRINAINLTASYIA